MQRRSLLSISNLVSRLLCIVFALLLAPRTSAQHLTFTQLTAAAPWDVRSEALLFAHPLPLTYYPPTSNTTTTSSPNSLILYGGRGPGSQFDNDVWLYDPAQSDWTILSGTDGTSGSTASAASGPQTYVTYPGNALCADASGQTLYVVSGFTSPAYYDYSTDGGVSWNNNQSSTLPFPARSFGTCSVDPRTGTVYMMGGLSYLYGGSPDPTYNDVWKYTPGTGSWTQVTAAAAWPSRNALSSAAVHNEVLGTTLLYMTGGLTNTQVGFGFADAGDVGSSDVWVSSNGGLGWSMLTNNSFPNRALARLVIAPSGVLVLAEGATSIQLYPHDVWASADGGSTWGLCSSASTASYPERRSHSSAIDAEGYLWLTGGECYTSYTSEYCVGGQGKYNDVWRKCYQLQ